MPRLAGELLGVAAGWLLLFCFFVLFCFASPFALVFVILYFVPFVRACAGQMRAHAKMKVPMAFCGPATVVHEYASGAPLYASGASPRPALGGGAGGGLGPR